MRRLALRRIICPLVWFGLVLQRNGIRHLTNSLFRVRMLHRVFAGYAVRCQQGLALGIKMVLSFGMTFIGSFLATRCALISGEGRPIGIYRQVLGEYDNRRGLQCTL